MGKEPILYNPPYFNHKFIAQYQVATLKSITSGKINTYMIDLDLGKYNSPSVLKLLYQLTYYHMELSLGECATVDFHLSF